MARVLVEKTLNHRLVGSTAWKENDLKDIHHRSSVTAGCWPRSQLDSQCKTPT